MERAIYELFEDGERVAGIVTRAVLAVCGLAVVLFAAACMTLRF